MGTPDFQAVVLAAGKGSRFSEVAAQKHKCLLPLANLPMLWYPLNMLQRCGFQEVLVITHEQCRSEVSSLPKRLGLDLKLDVCCVPNDELGTADALRAVHDRLCAQRILVVSSDLVTDLQLQHLTDLHRVNGAALTALFSRSRPDSLKNIPVPGPKSKPKRERDFVGLDPSTHQLCYHSSEADIEEFVNVRKSVLMEHPRVKILTDLMDAHMYILEKWVCDYLQHHEQFASIKGELIPHIVRFQFSRGKKVTQNDDDDGVHERADVVEEKRDINSFVPTDEMTDLYESLSSWNDHSGDLEPAFHKRRIRCYAYIMDGGLCARANNLHSYCDLNRRLPKLNRDLPQPIHPTSQIQPKAQVGPECLVGANTYLSDKTTTKNSIVGASCKIEQKVRLTNSILMDHVTVKEGSNVVGSLLCEGAVIPERCEIKDCIVGKGYTVTAGAKHTNETLVEEQQDKMMEI